MGRERDGRVETGAESGAEAGHGGVARLRVPASQRSEPPRPHWRTLLSGATPREVLARLMAGDPLALRARVAVALAEHGHVLDPDRVLLRVAARVARFAARYRGQPELDAWLRSHVDEALLELCEEDREGRSLESGGALAVIASPLGIELDALQRACRALNLCPTLERRAFRLLVIESKDLDLASAELGLPATEVARAARRALEATLAASEEVTP